MGVLEFTTLEEIEAAVAPLDVPPKADAPPLTFKWYNARRVLSTFCWDIFTAQCLYYYAQRNGVRSAPALSERGLMTGVFPKPIAEGLLTAFRACPAYDPPYSGQETARRHFFGPGVGHGTSEYLGKRFITRQMTGAMADALKIALDSVAEQFNVAMGHYWAVSHIRLYERMPEEWRIDDGSEWHVDGWPVGLKKLYIYVDGASAGRGTTKIRVPGGSRIDIEGPPGVWALFENSLIVHSAQPSRDKWRPAIEVSLYPALETDTTPVHMGVTGNFPWYPIDFEKLEHPAMPKEFKGRALEYRCLMRTLGLAQALEFKDTSLGVDPFHVPEGWNPPATVGQPGPISIAPAPARKPFVHRVGAYFPRPMRKIGGRVLRTLGVLGSST